MTVGCLLKALDDEEGSRRKRFLRASARKTDDHTLSVFQICHESARVDGRTCTRACVRTYIMRKPSGHFHIHIYMYMRHIAYPTNANLLKFMQKNHKWPPLVSWEEGTEREREIDRGRERGERERVSSIFIWVTLSKLKFDTLHHSNLYANVETSICDGQNSINWDDRK